MSIFWQHTVLTTVLGAFTAILGGWLNKRLIKIEVHLNGRMTGLETRISNLESGANLSGN